MTENKFDIGNIPPQLRESMLHGKGAEDIKWGSGGDFNRCRAFLAEHGVPKKFWDGECAELHKAATGFWPGRGREHGLVAGADVHTGAMVALIPSAADAGRMAMKGGEAPEELHVTLAYLGNAADWSTQDRLEMAATVARHLEYAAVVRAEAFALGYFNPHSEDTETALVYGIGGSDVQRVYSGVRQAIGNYGQRMPTQHAPFVAHMTAKYTDNLNDHRGLVENLGPLAFDRVRLAFGEDHYDIPLGKVDLEALTASMGNYSAVTWSGPLAPIGSPTGDRRIFPANRLTYQTFPMPLRFQRKGMPGHDGAVVVGRILGAAEGELNGKPFILARGDWFNPDIIPEVTEAMALVEGGVSGPSVDLDTFTAAVADHEGKPILEVREGRVRGATLVSIPAFADLRLELQYPPEPMDEPAMESPDPVGDLVTPEADTSDPLGDAMVASVQEFASVNASGWKGAPIAPRDAAFDADDAVSRIEAWAGIGTDSPDQAKMSKMFLWVNPDGNALGRDGYKLPWGDIFDDKPHLVYHAIYAASALLEGGHGGLPNIPVEDKNHLRSVISDIYAKLAVEFGDPNIQASWDRAAQQATLADIEEFKHRPGGGRTHRYTESKHPRDPKGTDQGGEWVDVPGHGPHGEILKGGKKSGGESGGGSKAPDKAGKAPAKAEPKAATGSHLAGKAALDSAPVKLSPSEEGHSGNYDGATATGPKGMGSVKALAQMEGVEHERVNNYLRKDRKSTANVAHITAQLDETIAEVDKSMKVSELPHAVTVHRGVKDGSLTFGEDAWYGFAFEGDTRAEQDANWARWQAGERPDLTGLTWTEKGYSHTTVLEDKVEGYAKKTADLEPVAMKIVVPRGTRGIQMSGMDKEAELMLQRGLRYRVIKDHGVDGKGIRRLDVEVVSHGD